MEDLAIPGFDHKRDITGKRALVTKTNFGCGSSREHAPWALEVNGINIVVAAGFARIFRQNMFNCGLLAVELPLSEIEELFQTFSGRECTLDVDIQNTILNFSAGETKKELHFKLAGFERALIEAGGWVEYAAKRY
ncbi:MAG: 3-isopropylmalate dehydratase small subunit [Termitinemataceae bacterium]|nr:MAG: 3-isopropylmalate dehydratase small subunit [Termitinemataceae bacterium]